MPTEALSSVSNALAAARKEARQGYLIAHGVPASEESQLQSMDSILKSMPFQICAITLVICAREGLVQNPYIERKAASKLLTLKTWLPGMGSNHELDKSLKSLTTY